jgi:hypothetical protein
MKSQKNKLAYAKVYILQAAFTDKSISLEQICVNKTYVIADDSIYNFYSKSAM